MHGVGAARLARVAVTARVTTLKGASAGEYYVEALPSYYLDSNEPAGLWYGHGAELLGLAGEVVDGEFLRIMAGLDPYADDEVPLGRPYGEESVRGFDVTASAPKSVSTLFAVGDDHTRGQVLAGHDTAVSVVINWIETHAHTRYRINGEVAVVDAAGIIAAAFRQHTSRALDPQLHTHVVIANRVASPDGRWLALDARSLKMDQRTVSAIYHATLRSELSQRLGVEWEPVENGIAEIAHMPDGVLEEFKSRTADVQRRVDEKLDRFVDTFDRGPTQRERWRLEREAVLDSRPPKSHGTDAADLHREWVERVEALGHRPELLVAEGTGHEIRYGLDAETVEAMIDQAIETLSEKQSSWRPAELTREIAAAIPTSTAVGPDEIGAFLDAATRYGIEQRCVDISRPIPTGAGLRRDGRPFTESIANRTITTDDILAQEHRLLAWADRRTTDPGIDSVGAVDRSQIELTAPQAETAAAAAGTAELVLVVGPAGTGKTTALAPAVEQLRAEGRAVFGVAPSAAAAEVLASETGVDADTIDKLLVEHSLERPPEHRYDLPAGATVIVDEAGMVATDKLDAFADLADYHGWRVAMVGDPMQFSAVGRGGMFQHLTHTHGAIELDQVRRFSNDWERDASMRLRRGDPTIAAIYESQGRLHGGTATRMRRDALDAWWDARSSGESVVLAAPTNDTVTELNHAAQQRRIDTGHLDPSSRSVEAGAYRLWVGDEIATRRNDRLLRTDRGLMIRNRDHWTIQAIHPNDDITIAGRTGTIRLPADYVTEHVELAYAQTSHATQGRTVDRAILVLDTPTDVRGIYVPMTRGRRHNHAYITTTPGEDTALDIFTDTITRNWIDQPALARQAELAANPPHAPGAFERPAQRPRPEQQAQLTPDQRAPDPAARHIVEAELAVMARLDALRAERRRLLAELVDVPSVDDITRLDHRLVEISASVAEAAASLTASPPGSGDHHRWKHNLESRRHAHGRTELAIERAHDRRRAAAPALTRLELVDEAIERTIEAAGPERVPGVPTSPHLSPARGMEPGLDLF